MTPQELRAELRTRAERADRADALIGRVCIVLLSAILLLQLWETFA